MIIYFWVRMRASIESICVVVMEMRRHVPMKSALSCRLSLNVCPHMRSDERLLISVFVFVADLDGLMRVLVCLIVCGRARTRRIATVPPFHSVDGMTWGCCTVGRGPAHCEAACGTGIVRVRVHALTDARAACTMHIAAKGPASLARGDWFDTISAMRTARALPLLRSTLGVSSAVP